ncbi:ZC11A [Hepatospora eriocheir]|uniref:ZC11A n=1 Tax=Hepatospora eriocheir TaxID=1081669 RepID=A0A1X0QJU1_9MICR|nr:ZC11A [Hepatospora eriocheir]
MINKRKLEKKSTEDCYYFLYSVCILGNACLYRHNELSKQCNVLCDEWDRTEKCREDCPFRHSRYHLKKQRSDELCYWESNGGCKKEFCEYKHNDPTKDQWKKGVVKNLNTVRKEKNKINREEIKEEDLEKFEEERQEIKKLKLLKLNKNKSLNYEKVNILMLKKLSGCLSDDKKQLIDIDIEKLKNDIILVCNKLNNLRTNTITKNNSGSDFVVSIDDDLDAELEELNKLID